MSPPERVIRPTAAEHVREGDWVLAAWEGTLGCWRVTRIWPGHDRATEADAVHLIVSLRLIRCGDSSQVIEQLHRWDALVPLLVPIPEPPVIELEAQTLEPQHVQVNVTLRDGRREYEPGYRPCRAEPVNRGDGLMLWPCRYCGSTDWKLRCPAQ